MNAHSTPKLTIPLDTLSRILRYCGPHAVAVFIRLAERAVVEPTRILVGGEAIQLQPGMLVTTLRELADQDDSDPHFNKVRLSLEKLVGAQDVAQDHHRKNRVITLVNFSKFLGFQNGDNFGPQDNHRMSTGWPQDDGQNAALPGYIKGFKNKKKKEEEEEEEKTVAPGALPAPSSLSSFGGPQVQKRTKKGFQKTPGIRNVYSDDFQGLWLAYGCVGSKARALEAYQRLELNSEAYSALQKAVENYASKFTSDRTYQKHFSTFLLDDWRGYAEAPPSGAAKIKKLVPLLESTPGIDDAPTWLELYGAQNGLTPEEISTGLVKKRGGSNA